MRCNFSGSESARTAHLLRRVNAHRTVVMNFTFTPDGKGLLSGSWETIKHWDVSSLYTVGPLEAADDELLTWIRFGSGRTESARASILRTRGSLPYFLCLFYNVRPISFVMTEGHP